MARCNEPRSYIVQMPNGTRLRRTRMHLRELEWDGRFSNTKVDPTQRTYHSPPVDRRVHFNNDNDPEKDTNGCSDDDKSTEEARHNNRQ